MRAAASRAPSGTSQGGVLSPMSARALHATPAPHGAVSGDRSEVPTLSLGAFLSLCSQLLMFIFLFCILRRASKWRPRQMRKREKTRAEMLARSPWAPDGTQTWGRSPRRGPFEQSLLSIDQGSPAHVHVRITWRTSEFYVDIQAPSLESSLVGFRGEEIKC